MENKKSNLLSDVNEMEKLGKAHYFMKKNCFECNDSYCTDWFIDTTPRCKEIKKKWKQVMGNKIESDELY